MRLNIDRAAVVYDSARNSTSPSAGTIVVATDRLYIQTGENVIEILELQPAGKRAMQVGEFLRGYRPAVSDVFGSA